MSEINKEFAEKILSKVPQEKRFYCQDGVYLSDLEELGNYLKKVKIETYKIHANHEKNDFANWVYDVIGDTSLATEIRKSKNRKELREILRNRLKYLRAKAGINE